MLGDKRVLEPTIKRRSQLIGCKSSCSQAAATIAAPLCRLSRFRFRCQPERRSKTTTAEAAARNWPTRRKHEEVSRKLAGLLAAAPMSSICIGYHFHLRHRQSARSMWLLILVAAVIMALPSQTSALKVSVAIPELVKLNDAFWLNCSHAEASQQSHHQRQQHHHHQQQSASISNLQGDSSASGTTRTLAPTNANGAQDGDIYAIKWYKDDEEFYRFLPNAEPKVSIYETNGIQLDQTRSREGNVLISKADVNSEGSYRCEILSEAPLFETVRKSKHLRVYALPVRGPRIEILDQTGRPKIPRGQEIAYAVGDKIELRCNSAPSKPAAKLRWYLNEHEINMPTNQQQSANVSSSSATALLPGYEVKVTPVEFRQHYKGIQSSHSTLSLVLQQDNLINNKISFKCLASMRQEVQLRSKQLIVLTPSMQIASSSSSSSPSFAQRQSRRLLVAEGDGHVILGSNQRTRPQQHRHSMSRLSSSARSSGNGNGNNLNSNENDDEQFKSSSSLSSELLTSQGFGGANLDSQLMYIYEDSEATLGSSIIDSPANLESYLQRRGANESSGGSNTGSDGNYQPGSIEFNRADNLETVQMLRDRLARQRSFPTQASSQSSSSASSSSQKNRPHGPNSLVKSPLYLDENDPLRPIISWPPLDAGKLVLLPPSNTIVAITTANPSTSSSSRPAGSVQKLILPPRSSGAHHLLEGELSIRGKLSQQQLDGVDQSYTKRAMLEKLIQNLNCTSTEAYADTKLGWLVNESPLESKDVRFYPARTSPDHRQTWLTVGLKGAQSGGGGGILSDSSASFTHSQLNQQQKSQVASKSLQHILGQYFKTSDSQIAMQSNVASSLLSRSSDTNQLDQANNQIKFTCQAVHSMLLYSSSEMITFDFNPPAPIEGNSIGDKFVSSSSNVIQATSASQSSSAAQESLTIIRSQRTFILSILTSIIFTHLYIFTIPYSFGKQ